MHVVLIANDTTFIYNLRREIIQRLLADGHRVTLLTQARSFREELEATGAEVINVDTPRRGTSIIGDLKLLGTYWRLLRRLRPDAVLTNNIKPNAYGGMVCRMLGIRYLPNITGLGTAVETPGRMQALTTRLYKWGVAGADCIFFQNEENVQFFRDRGMMPKKARLCMLPGSGVNLQQHQAEEYPPEGAVHFLYVARAMKEKGIDLYLNAARAIHEKYADTVFHICGMCDDERYMQILRDAQAEGYILYHGEQKDMVPYFRQTHCLVHPSYYPEGMSNVLLEAAASARPIIATDRSGCRETVDDGVSGYIVPVKDEAALIGALDRFMQLDWAARRAMGLAGRAKVEREFDRRTVVDLVVRELERAEAAPASRSAGC